MINIIQTEYDPPEFELNAITTSGRTRIYTLRGARQVDKFNATMAGLGPDGPMLVGSPKTLATLRAGGTL